MVNPPKTLYYRVASRCLLLVLPLVAPIALATPEEQSNTDATSALNTPVEASPSRPAIKANRWQEDWSALANPQLRTESLDSLKYIALSSYNPATYLSLGATLRERFESNDASGFGSKGVARDSYLLQRFQVHADLHFNEHWRLFTQLEDARAYDKTTLSSADQDRADLRLAFLEYTRKFDSNTLKARVGRQDFAFDLQRFVSSRDGPNVRQSFDAAWANWETGTWRFSGFVSRPVQYFDDRPFDDKSDSTFQFHMLRAERLVWGGNELSAYYALYEHDAARYLDASGNEHRNVFDARFAGAAAGFDWDIEGMGQSGSVGAKTIRAWAAGSRAGYTLSTLPWRPRVGIQMDIASGDSHPGDQTLGTFNPLFPNGYYFSLAGYTGYANLIHVKPSITVTPISKLSVMTAVGLLWRQTTEDAVYVQPNLPVSGTAGQGNRWTGAYGQMRTDYAFNANLTGAIEAVHYQIGQSLRNAGGHDSNYLGVELKFGW
ncbi:alginate export family protein [Pseudomonas gingeri]|uniref:alginate export family protein n=1 Tax=Pseudomonas gingeri TaxID=117681 RepID=UPI0015A40FDD|nr:alginate export family protein [Pseudomonas gingeri]NWD76931.1 alginate export family protein [Pseudomonas gingeri]